MSVATINYQVEFVRYALHSATLPLVQDALPFAEQVRRALIRHRADAGHSEVITGKKADGVPLEGHTHAHYLPTDEDGDGRLDHVTIYASHGFTAEDQTALSTLRTLHRKGNRPEIQMILAGLGAKKDLVDSFMLLGPSRCWRSATPFSLPRFATRGAGKPARPRDMPEAQLVREMRVRGLPEPVSIRRIDGYNISGRPLVRWLEFQAQRFKGDTGYGLAGFEVEFAKEVSGPIALGFACHFGLGLFTPA